MKFVEHDGNFQIAPDDVVSYDKLPAGYYKINYDEKHDLYSLDRTYEFTLNENKIYGVSVEKHNKIVDAFDKSTRSLGVLLSGDKGIGKSLFSRLLCMTMFSKGYPIIIIDKSYKGLERFLSDIPGDIVMLFDEFDKVFEKGNNSEGRDETSQESLLSLFDGTGTQKRLFIITANDLYLINDCILDRPGRFHYHLIFDYPTKDDITKYLKDNAKNISNDEIEKVCKLSNYININYDILRSIVFEYNLGYKIEDFIDDLNIKNCSKSNINYEFVFTDKDGKEIILHNTPDQASIYSDAPSIDLNRKKYDFRAEATIDILSKEFGKDGAYVVIPEGCYEINIYSSIIESIDTTKPVKVRKEEEKRIDIRSMLK